MSQISVDAPRHELVPVLLLHLHRVVEITARLRHGECARALADGDHHESNNKNGRGVRFGLGEYTLRPRRRRRRRGSRGEEKIGGDAFEQGGRVRDVVCAAVLAEEEGGDGGVAGVVGGCGPVFEEVEEG